MKISEASGECGLSPDTIRFYEKSGLVQIARGADGLRRFSPENVEWLTLLYWLRQTGMPMKVMHRFASLYQQGAETIGERKALLLQHAEHLRTRRQELDCCELVLAHKVSTYEALERSIA
ncbi:MerR family transcriptional regulator [Roseibium sp.]|uniref:MerR family transcriptional regulator n=1 Tax=Roseibium sp. TaxID=1936156 RepID=UPI003A979AA7